MGGAGGANAMIPIQYALRRRMMMAAMASVDISALSITYTGDYTDYGMVTMSDGARYRLLAFTSSGTLSIEQPVNCEVCVVGGGANGQGAGGSGGAGGYLKNQAITKYNGGAVVVGAAQAASSVGEVSVKAVSGKNGGTGGGGSGVGDGISKYPFGDESYSLWTGKPHCGGGGGGAIGSDYEARESSYDGGNGGTNGGSGADSKYVGSGRYGSGGSSGPYGGGKGADASDWSPASGGSATYYGSGGGGGAKWYYVYSETTYNVVSGGGSGYQGIVYMRIPVIQ